MDLQEVKTFIETNSQDSAVSEYLSELKKPTAEVVNSYLDSQEGAKLLQPRLDSHFSKGLQTWKDNNLSKLIDEEVSKRNPGETPEQKEIRELKAQLESDRLEREREKLTNLAMKKANDEDETNTNLESFNELFQNAVQSQVDAKFKNNGREVKTFESGQNNSNNIAEIANQFNIRK